MLSVNLGSPLVRWEGKESTGTFYCSRISPAAAAINTSILVLSFCLSTSWNKTPFGLFCVSSNFIEYFFRPNGCNTDLLFNFHSEHILIDKFDFFFLSLVLILTVLISLLSVSHIMCLIFSSSFIVSFCQSLLTCSLYLLPSFLSLSLPLSFSIFRFSDFILLAFSPSFYLCLFYLSVSLCLCLSCSFLLYFLYYLFLLFLAPIQKPFLSILLLKPSKFKIQLKFLLLPIF